MEEWTDRDLAKRFVSDYKLPIQIINEDLFCYSLITLGVIPKWVELKKIVKDKFNNNNNEFLEEYYRIRDNIITSVLNNEAYQKFNTMSMSKYQNLRKEANISSKNIYNQENVGKNFISIDLKKANFQVLNKIDKNILFNSDTYEEFIGKFTDLSYVKNSKYTRQVIFGKLNPSRHITIEKYYTLKIYELLSDKLELTKDYKITSISNDEVVYEVSVMDENSEIEEVASQIETLIKEELGLIVHVEYFKLKGFELCYKSTESPKFTFYSKVFNNNEGNYKLVSVPLPYYLIIRRLYKGLIPLGKDYHFNYEGCDCIFNEEFIVKEITKGNDILVVTQN